LLNLKASKEREVEAHDRLKPVEVVKPEADPAQQVSMENISQQIGDANAKRDILQETIRASDSVKKIGGGPIRECGPHRSAAE
jgi:hypothetical protein